MQRHVDYAAFNATSIQPLDQVPPDDLGGSETPTDPDAERRAASEARAKRRLVKNLILASICLLLLVATIWVLLVVGPL